MRPRVFPAEDGGHRDGAAGRQCTSMRPRVFPAEDMVVWALMNRRDFLLQ